MMNDVFILGAGFSKAVSSGMPIIKGGELSKEVLTRYKYKDAIPAEIRLMIEENFESALSFLASEKPWLSESENQRHRAIYLELTYVIRAVFCLKSKDPCVWNVNSPQHWLEELIAYWHNNRCAVISLNYDTLIECIASTIYSRKRPAIQTSDLYPIHFTQAVLTNDSIRIESSQVKKPMETFRLFKLHGSINWFYSGRFDFFGEELFCVPCSGGIDNIFDGADNADWRRLNGKCPLIIPPTSDKSAFFRHEALRSMWFQAGESIKRASRIFCLGYSIPESDITMSQFLKNCAPPSRIPFEIVDLKRKEEHFANVLGKESFEFRQVHETETCIPKFVVQNLVSDKLDKMRILAERPFSKSSVRSKV